MTIKHILGWALVASVFSLVAAYIAQYGFGLKPCHLCLWQRMPYGVVIVLVAANFIKPLNWFLICSFLLVGLLLSGPLELAVVVNLTLLIIVGILIHLIPRQWLIVFIGLIFLIGSGIAAYHVGVEKNWVKGPSGCTAPAAESGQSTEDFLNRIKQAPVVACDQPVWQWHGITMAGMNAAWSFALAAATFAALQQMRRKPHA